jgi:hypothetical protein
MRTYDTSEPGQYSEWLSTLSADDFADEADQVRSTFMGSQDNWEHDTEERMLRVHQEQKRRDGVPGY